MRHQEKKLVEKNDFSVWKDLKESLKFRKELFPYIKQTLEYSWITKQIPRIQN